MEEIIGIATFAVIIVIFVVAIIVCSQNDKKQKEKQLKFMKECRENGISFEHPEDAAEIMTKYGIDADTAKTLFAAECEQPEMANDSIATIITVLTWILSILGLIGSFIWLYYEFSVIAISGIIASVIFLLMLLGLARIINYLFRISRNTQRIAELLEKKTDK